MVTREGTGKVDVAHHGKRHAISIREPLVGIPLKAVPGGDLMGLAGAHQLDQPSGDRMLQRLPEANGGTSVGGYRRRVMVSASIKLAVTKAQSLSSNSSFASCASP